MTITIFDIATWCAALLGFGGVLDVLVLRGLNIRLYDVVLSIWYGLDNTTIPDLPRKLAAKLPTRRKTRGALLVVSMVFSAIVTLVAIGIGLWLGMGYFSDDGRLHSLFTMTGALSTVFGNPLAGWKTVAINMFFDLATMITTMKILSLL